MKWVAAGCAAVAIALAAAWAVTVAGTTSSPTDLAPNLYAAWRAQMRIVAYAARPMLPPTKSVRLRQVAQVEAQNQRAAGMVALAQHLQGGDTTERLTGALATINAGVDQMLQRMMTGYNGPGTVAAARDIGYIRRLVQQNLLRRFPPAAPSDRAVQELLPALRALGSHILDQIGKRFTEDG